MGLNFFWLMVNILKLLSLDGAFLKRGLGSKGLGYRGIGW